MIRLSKRSNTYISMKDEKNSDIPIMITVISVLLIIMAVILSIPTIYICRYAYPWADDFSYGAETHATFIATKSVIKTLAAAFVNVLDSYCDWQGTYTSCFFMSLQPAVFGTRAYHFTGLIMLGAMFISYFVFFYILLYKLFKIPKSVSLSIFALTYIITIENVEAIPEAFTWFNGAVHYTFNHAMFVLFIALVLNYVKLKKKISMSKDVVFPVLCLMGFLTAGGNNITVLSGAIVVIFIGIGLFLYDFIIHKNIKTSYRSTYLILFSFVLGTLVNFLAPGNRKRMGIVGEPNPIFKTVIDSFITGAYSLSVFSTWEFWLVIFLTGILIWYGFISSKTIYESDFEFPLPGLVIFLSFCLLSAEFFPPIFTAGEIDSIESLLALAFSMERVNNCIYYNFVLLVVLNLFYVLGWIYKKGIRPSNKIAVAILSVIVVITLVIFINIKIQNNPTYYLTSAAITNLKNETAQYYGYQMQENTNRLKSDEQDVLVMPIAVDPSSLYPKDASDWKEGIRLFYQKESVEYESEPYTF